MTQEAAIARHRLCFHRQLCLPNSQLGLDDGSRDPTTQPQADHLRRRRRPPPPRPGRAGAPDVLVMRVDPRGSLPLTGCYTTSASVTRPKPIWTQIGCPSRCCWTSRRMPPAWPPPSRTTAVDPTIAGRRRPDRVFGEEKRHHHQCGTQALPATPPAAAAGRGCALE